MMPDDRSKEPLSHSAGRDKPGKGGLGHPDARPSTESEDSTISGGTEQPKNDRRKRGDLHKRGPS
jgi:hypothetical protein